MEYYFLTDAVYHVNQELLECEHVMGCHWLHFCRWSTNDMQPIFQIVALTILGNSLQVNLACNYWGSCTNAPFFFLLTVLFTIH